MLLPTLYLITKIGYPVIMSGGVRAATTPQSIERLLEHIAIL
jgi:hypothetical protein